MWKIYDELLDGIAPGPGVDDSFIGKYWTMARSGNSVGLAMTLHGSARPLLPDLLADDPACAGITLRYLSEREVSRK
jgi:hypothetical protein